MQFDAQVATLVEKGYPALAGLGSEEFTANVAPLRERLPVRAGSMGIPFVLVVSASLVPVEATVPLLSMRAGRGFTDMSADDLDRFGRIDGVELPGGFAYLLTDVDTGRDRLNVTPDDALAMIRQAGRSPLTLQEGIALVTQFAGVLRERNCFSMLGSRCGDRRVTALWISKHRPRLGWCWAGNPHTWLGSASCAGRVGVAAA